MRQGTFASLLSCMVCAKPVKGMQTVQPAIHNGQQASCRSSGSTHAAGTIEQARSARAVRLLEMHGRPSTPPAVPCLECGVEVLGDTRQQVPAEGTNVWQHCMPFDAGGLYHST